MEPVRLISQYIAPWALAKEEIPLHLIWESISEYDKIELLIPEDIVLKEFYNVDSYTEYDEKIIVENLKTPNFFGLTVASKDVLKEMHVKRKIIINFIRNNEVIYSTARAHKSGAHRTQYFQRTLLRTNAHA